MTDLLWTLEDFAQGCAGRVVGPATGPVTGISIDSRSVQPGEAYFSIRGDVHDGHAFAGAALEKGAAVAVVSEEKLAEMPEGGRYIVVDDVLDALRRLGVAARARVRGKIIAVTGSAGKTSTKEALRVVLGDQGKVHASVASFNNHWGVPLTLARMPQDVDFGIFEIGMNHAGEITDLVALVRPHVAIVTTVAPVHLEYFGTTAKIAEAKAEIFSGLVPGGVAIINGDLTETPILVDAAKAAGAKIVTFGRAPERDVRSVWIELYGDRSRLLADIRGEKLIYTLGVPGQHLAQNSLAVLAAVQAVGADLTRAGASLAKLQQPKGRGNFTRLTVGNGTALLIDESYNANPASMRAALALLGQVGKGTRRIAVLGDMLELGDEGPRLHAGLLEAIEAAEVDLVFLAGPLMENLWSALPRAKRGGYARSSASLQQILFDHFTAGDTIMVKGSNGSRMGPLVEALKAQFQ